MSEVSSRPDQLAAVQRAQLLGFVEGFKRECGERIAFINCELRTPVQGDELIIFVSFVVDGRRRAIGAIGYHLPDICATYEELGVLCAQQCAAGLPPNTVLHHRV